MLRGDSMNIYKDAFVIAVIIISICSSTEGIGCPEPVVEKAQIEFIDPLGEDGLYPRGTIISVQCIMGATIKGSRFVSCLETDTWDTLPTCTRTTGNIKCPMPPKPWNGQIKRIGRRSAIVSCDKGFTLYGKKKIICAMTAGIAQWPRSVCRASNKCSNPGNLTGGDWTLLSADRSSSKNSEFSPNTKINVTCRPGFVLVGKPKVKCGMDGRWNPTLPTCEEIRCPPLIESIPHGQSGMNRTYKYKQGDVVDYFCDTGYRIFGKTTRVCSVDSADGTWSHLNPICKEILCPHPGVIQHGNLFLASDRIGGNVTFYCRSGYQIRGSAVRHCLPSGKWSGELTTCDHEDFYCPNPGIPIGGYMENQETADFQRGDVVRYACNSNRVLVGSAERHCNKSRSWSGEAPLCQSPFDFNDISEVAEKIGYVAESLSISIDTTSGSKGRSIDLTYDGGYDIYFAFDASGSIARAHFETALDFAKILVEKIGVKNARYAACIYATRTLSSLLISDQQNSVEEVLNQIDALAEIRGSDDIKTGTATGKALQFIHTDMIPLSERHLPRSKAKKVLFLFTDGHTNEGASEAIPKEEAEILRDDYNVQIHCIGVTHEVDISELKDIASKPLSEHLFLIADYRELDLLAQAITNQKLDYSKCGYNGGPQRAVHTKGRIAGGEDAPLYNWPWQVALYCEKFQQQEFFCGGTLIAPNWVLTAAHCLTCNWTNIRVYTGLNDRSLMPFNTMMYEIDGEDALIKHTSYRSSSFANDIALLRLRGHAPLSPRVRTICMPQEDIKESSLYSSRGALPYVTGWGVTEPYEISRTREQCDHTTEETITNRLQQLEIPLVSDDECDKSFEEDAYLCSTLLDFKREVSFCAGNSEGGLDACKGDSGGPVMRELLMSDQSKRWVQIGIVSWGEGCAQKGRYGFYTRLSRYIRWIQQHVGNSIFNINN